MSKELLLSKEIELHPQYLNKDIKQHIINKIKEKNECTEEYGFIVDVKRIERITSLPISGVTKFPVFKVDFTAITLIPEVGKEFESTITRIFETGLFIECGVIKVFVPYTELKGYNYGDKSFKKGKKEIKVDQMIKVLIKNINYSEEENCFKCIATLAEKLGKS